MFALITDQATVTFPVPWTTISQQRTSVDRVIRTATPQHRPATHLARALDLVTPGTQSSQPLRCVPNVPRDAPLVQVLARATVLHAIAIQSTTRTLSPVLPVIRTAQAVV